MSLEPLDAASVGSGGLWSVDPLAILAILAMALATYATRALGLFLIQRLRPSRFLERFLHHLPGAMFVALVAPAVVAAGTVGALGALAVLTSARAGAPLVVALVVGAGSVALLRLAGVS